MTCGIVQMPAGKAENRDDTARIRVKHQKDLDPHPRGHYLEDVPVRTSCYKPFQLRKFTL